MAESFLYRFILLLFVLEIIQDNKRHKPCTYFSFTNNVEIFKELYCKYKYTKDNNMSTAC